jgi:hypothetical protein
MFSSFSDPPNTSHTPMPMSRPRSLKHEYELYVEHEIEEYKDSVPRSALLAIGDEAVLALREQAQTTLTEMVLWEEVDRIIASRLRIPSFSTWKRRRLKMLQEFRRPEHLGVLPGGIAARELAAAPDGHVLVAGTGDEGAAMFLAAHGCDVTALGREPDAVERVMHAAEVAGLSTRVRGYVSDVATWSPDVELRAVVCTPAAFTGLSAPERAQAIAVLQSATADGGVHLVQTIVAAHAALTLDELRSRYLGWSISVEGDGSAAPTFLARKTAAA